MFGLCDGVHIWWTGYSYGVKNAFKGKEKYTTVVFNVTVDYDGKPIFVSDLATGTTNDKLLVNNHDDFVGTVTRVNPVFTEYLFKLSTKDGTVLTKGAYLGVDNGYHHERRFVAPSKHERCGTWAYTWSKWLESLRKKVECFFGRLKRKYRILSQGINMRQLGRKTMQRSDGTVVEVGSVEDIFKVCCCLDVMVQEDKGAYCGGEPDWRQLDDAELEEVEGVHGETPAWLELFKTRQAALDEEARQAALPGGGRVELPEPEPEPEISPAEDPPSPPKPPPATAAKKKETAAPPKKKGMLKSIYKAMIRSAFSKDKEAKPKKRPNMFTSPKKPPQ
mmetsp:Transcript_11662/g.48862  ORF Transcript_11662/g.48862 Transcript_11662/m.48862 type:complete len:334 (-) Transcript_11662:939-1940(-)